MADNFADPWKVKAFLAKFRDEPGTGCRLWDRPFPEGKAPQVGWNGTVRSVRRVAWQIEHGDMPTGMEVRSSCGVPACAAHGHLFLSTTAERCAATRAARKALPAAHYAPRGRLSDADTAIVKSMVAGGVCSPVPRKVLAELYDVHPNTITRTWNEAREDERIRAVYLARDAERTAREAAEAPAPDDCPWFAGERFDKPVTYRDLNPFETAAIYLLGKKGPEEDRWSCQRVAAYVQCTPATVRRIWRDLGDMFKAGEERREERREAMTG